MMLPPLVGLWAQDNPCTYSAQGTILDIETKEPIPFVTIQVKGTDRVVLSDIDGNFIIKNLCSEENTLIVSCFGYCDSECEDHHQHGKSPHIYLTQDVLNLESVTIEAERIKEAGTATLALTNIDKDELREALALTLANVVSQVDGVSVVSTGSNVQIPIIHGLYGNRISILNNGLKHGFQNWGADHAPEIDISSSHNITVIKGAAGVRYGPEGLGGAINVKSNPLYLNEPFYTNINTAYQTNGRGFGTSFESGSATEKFAYSFGGKYNRVGDLNSPDYSLTNSGKQEIAGNVGLRYYADKWDFKIQYSYVNQELAILRSSVADSGNAFVRSINAEEPTFIRPFSYAIGEPNQLTQHHFGKAEIRWWYSDHGELTFRAGQQLNKRQEFDVRRNIEKPIIDLDLVTGDYQLEWKHPDWKKLDGIIGIQLFTQNGDNNPGTGTIAFIPNYNSFRYSAFVIESLKKDKHTFELGLRFDFENNDIRGRESNSDIFRDNYSFSNFTASLGYIKDFSENTTFRSNIGTAWRTPNIAELFSFGQQGFSSNFGLLRYQINEESKITTNNVTLLSESNVRPEVGYKFINEISTQKESSRYSLTGYAHYIEKFIFDRPVGITGTVRGPSPVFIIDQANAAFLGADFTWEKNWSEALDGTFSLSYLWSRNIENNEALIEQPPIRINYTLAWNTASLLGSKESTISINPSYTFEQFAAPRTLSAQAIIDDAEIITFDSEIFDFIDAPDAYFLLSASWKVEWKNISGGLTINNILNNRYRDYLNRLRYFADEPGINFLVSLNYSFNQKN